MIKLKLQPETRTLIFVKFIVKGNPPPPPPEPAPNYPGAEKVTPQPDYS